MTVNQSFRRLWPYIRPFRRDLVVIFLFGIGLACTAGTIPLLMQTLLEIYKGTHELTTLPSLIEKIPTSIRGDFTLTPDRQKDVIFWIPLAFPLVYFLQGFFRYANAQTVNFMSERVLASIRMDLVRKIVRLNLTYYGTLERGSGGLITRVFNDTQVLQLGLNFYADLTREPITIFVYFCYLLYIDWKLTLLILLFAPVFALVARVMKKSLRKYGKQGRESMDDLTSTLKETIDGVRVVQSFNLEKEMAQRFHSVNQRYLATVRKIVSRETAVSPINEFLASILVMGFAFYSISQVLNYQIDGLKFITFIVTAGLLQPPLRKLQDAGVKIQQTAVVSERIFSIIDHGTQVPEAKNPQAFPRDWKTIEFRNVGFNYGGEAVLKNVNLTVKRGEVIALVGESGSGKSTLVNLLERFYDPTSGEILIDGVSIDQIDLRDLRCNIALVTQDVFLFSDTIARNILSGNLDKSPEGIEAAARAANAHNFISSTPRGYESPVGERGSFLSGGEKQRVSIARAIFKDAPILILDEATSALDSVSEMEVQKGLNHLMEGRTAFVIAHRLSTIFNADRILVMKKGQIVEEGTHETLIARAGEYFNFFQLQTK